MEITTYHCKCCGNILRTDAHSLLFDNGYQIVFCQDCQIGFTSLTPKQNIERGNLLKNEYNLVSRLDTYFGRSIEFERRYEQALSLIEAHGKNRSVLDVGCNIGHWLNFLKKKGIDDIIGVETNDTCNKAGRQIFNLEIYKDIKEIKKTFDLITFIDVLEHLENPILFLSQIQSLTHPDTTHFFQLPNYQSGFARRLGKKWPWWNIPDHLLHFSPQGIKNLLKKAGFNIIELKTCDTTRDIIEYSLPELIRPFFRPLKYFHRTSGYIYRHSNKGSLIQVLGKKVLQ